SKPPIANVWSWSRRHSAMTIGISYPPRSKRLNRVTPMGPRFRPPGRTTRCSNTVSCSFCGKTQHEVETLIAGPPPRVICNEGVAISSDVLADQEILSLLKADEARANQSSPPAFAYLRGKSTEELALHVERGKKGAGHWRLGLQHIKRILAVRDGDVLAERDVPGNDLASPGCAVLTNA